MDIVTYIQVPSFIYNIYSNAAEIIGNCTTEDVLSYALTAYANYLFEDMVNNGEINIPNNET